MEAASVDPEDVFQMDSFWVQVKEVKENNQVIRSKTDSLSKLHAQTLESIHPEEKAELSRQTEKLMEEITVISNKNRILLKNISTDNKKISAEVGQSEPTMRMRSNQVNLNNLDSFHMNSRIHVSLFSFPCYPMSL